MVFSSFFLGTLNPNASFSSTTITPLLLPNVVGSQDDVYNTSSPNNYALPSEQMNNSSTFVDNFFTSILTWLPVVNYVTVRKLCLCKSNIAAYIVLTFYFVLLACCNTARRLVLLLWITCPGLAVGALREMAAKKGSSTLHS